MSNVINFEDEKRRREQIREHKIMDTHDAVLDLSDVVLTSDHFEYGLTVSDDSLIISMGDTEEN